MSDTKEKLSTEGSGFKGIRSGTENNACGKTTIEVGEPGKASKQMRANDTSIEMHTNRFPLHGAHPKKAKHGETLNPRYSGPGR